MVLRYDMLPLTNQPVYKDLLGWNEEEYPVAKWINETDFILDVIKI